MTGFTPFGKETVNPSYEAIRDLPDTLRNARILKYEIPTVFHKSISYLETLIKDLNPDIVICVGQAGGREGITLERVAINQDDALIPDNEGNQPIDTSIVPNGKNAYFSKLPIKAITHALNEARIPASVSNTAGTYVCNHLMYGLLHYIDTQHPQLKGGFVHVPYAQEQVVGRELLPSLPLKTLTEALTLVIKTTIETEYDLNVTGGAIA